MAQVDSKLIPWFWFLIMIGQVVLFWVFSGFPTSLSFKMDANPVWFMVPRSILMIVLTTIISGFALIFLFGERAFCRSICVFRLWFSWFERIAPHKIRQTKECSSCEGECSTICPMGLPVVEEVKNLGHIKNPECVKCFRCVGACPHGVLASSMQRNDFHKEGSAIVPESSLHASIAYLQAALAVILVTVFGFNIGGNIALSLGFLIGIIAARMLHDKSISWFEFSAILLLGVAMHYRIDMNDFSSSIKGLFVLLAFLLTARLLNYPKGLEFIAARAKGFKVPLPVSIIFIGLALFLGGREIHASMMIHKAKAAIARQDYPTYISAMISCADFVPNPAGAYFDLANAQLLQKDTEEAVKNYQKSLQSHFTEEAALVILSRLEDAGEEKGWLSMIDYLLKNHEKFASFKVLKAKYHILRKENESAETILNDVLKFNPDNLEALIALGNIRIDQDRTEDAKKLLEQAYKIDPAEGSVALASFYRWIEDFTSCEKYLAEAIGHFPENAGLLIERGVNFALQKQLEKAIECWQQALKIDPELEAAKLNITRAEDEIAANRSTQEPRPGPFRQNLPGMSGN